MGTPSGPKKWISNRFFLISILLTIDLSDMCSEPTPVPTNNVNRRHSEAPAFRLPPTPSRTFSLFTVGPRLTPRSKEQLRFTAISPSSSTVAVATKYSFWVWRTYPPSLSCQGSFINRNCYKYAVGERELATMHPLPDKFTVSSFSDMALSDEFVAIGTEEKIMIFANNGNHAGRWLVCDDMPKTGVIKLAFSNDGTQLVALVVAGDINAWGARIYSSVKFIPTMKRSKLIKSPQILDVVNIRWERDYVHSPTDMAWSMRGDMVAICTTCSKGKAIIRILKKEVLTWRLWGFHEVPVHAERRGLGFTGISLYDLFQLC